MLKYICEYAKLRNFYGRAEQKGTKVSDESLRKVFVGDKRQFRKIYGLFY